MSTTAASRSPNGWILFAALMLIMSGFLSGFLGLAGLLNDDVVTVGGGGVIVWSYTAWGVVHLLLGLAMVLTGWGLFAGAGWARWAAIFYAMLSGIAMIGVATAFPVMAIVIIGLDVIVIYQLTARWETA